MTTTQDTTYNGWTNYETWCVNLWLSNDEGTYNAVNEMARNAIGEQEDGSLDDAQYILADALKVFVEDLAAMTCPGVFEASFVADLYNAAISEVDWVEIARTWLSDLG